MINVRLLGFAAAVLAAPAYAQDLTQQEFQEISERVFRPVIEEFDIPGMAIGVTLHGEHYIFADGLADRAASRPVGPDTIFELGSNSKLFNGRCCRTQSVEDSHRESMRLDVSDDQAPMRPLPDDELEVLQ